MKNFIKYNLYAIIWAAIILILTLMPGKAIPTVEIVNIDKVVHFIIFGILMFLTLWGFVKQKSLKLITFNPVLVGYFLCINYGILIELIQNYIPGRGSSLYDAIANSIGVMIGHVLFKISLQKKITGH